jgi:biopolymer transport protein ExbD
MDLNRLRGLLAAPLAGLFLLLILCTFAGQRPASTGFLVPMIRLHHNPEEPSDCGGRSEFVRLTKDGKNWINDTEVPPDRLVSTVSDLMENRAERVVYVVVDSDLSYGPFAEFLDKVAGSTTDLHVVLVSGQILRAFQSNHDLCDFVYPAEEFKRP